MQFKPLNYKSKFSLSKFIQLFYILTIVVILYGNPIRAHADYTVEAEKLTALIVEWQNAYQAYNDLDMEKVNLDIALSKLNSSVSATTCLQNGEIGKIMRWNDLNNNLIPDAKHRLQLIESSIVDAKSNLTRAIKSSFPNIPWEQASRWTSFYVDKNTKTFIAGEIISTPLAGASTIAKSLTPKNVCKAIGGVVLGSVLRLTDLCAADMSIGGSFMGGSDYFPGIISPVPEQISNAQLVRLERNCRGYFDDLTAALSAIREFFGVQEQVPDTHYHRSQYNELQAMVESAQFKLESNCEPYGVFPYSSKGLILVTEPICGGNTGIHCTVRNLPPGSGGDKKREGVYGNPPPSPCGSVKPKKVLCTALYHQGLLPKRIWEADVAYADSAIDPETLKNYQAWASPIADIMSESPTLTIILKPIITSWANQMAYRMKVLQQPDSLGAFLETYGLPVSNFIGSRVRKLQKANSSKEAA